MAAAATRAANSDQQVLKYQERRLSSACSSCIICSSSRKDGAGVQAIAAIGTLPLVQALTAFAVFFASSQSGVVILRRLKPFLLVSRFVLSDVAVAGHRFPLTLKVPVARTMVHLRRAAR